MRKLSILLAFTLLFATGNAKQISQSQAASIAGKYLKTASRTLKALPSSTKDNSEYYIFNSGANNGFVIISGDDELTELVGYSDNGSFSTANMPENITHWLDGYANYVQQFREGKAQAKNIRFAAATPVVEPMITTKWNQKEPYNNLCPGNSYGICPTGCAATAYAQVMNYWEWPESGKGFHSYRNDFRTETVDFTESHYEWSKMRDEYLVVKNETGHIVEGWTEEEGNAVAKLMYDCGVAISMDYALNGSGATDYDIKVSAAKHFKYDSQLYPRNSFTSPQFMQIIKTELDKKRPVLFGGQGTGGGHEFVVDGYDSNDFLHVNWGWGGMSDGYFNIDYMDPDNLGTGGGSGGFCYDQSIVLLQPNKTGTPTTNDTYIGILPEGYLQDFAGYIKAIDTKVKKGEQMRFAINGLWNFSTNTYYGEVGFALFNETGERLTTPANTQSLTLEAAYLTTTESTISLGKELESVADGIYYVYPVSKQMDSKKETEWIRVSTHQNLMIQISGADISIFEEDLALKLMEPITANSKTFKIGQFVIFTSTLYNPTSQIAEGYATIEIQDAETGATVSTQDKKVMIYDQSSTSFKTQFRLVKGFKEGKSYRVTLSSDFLTTNDKNFTINAQPCNTLVFTIIDPAGVDDVTSNTDVTVYPNPTVNIVNIETDADIVSARLFTADGRLVKETAERQIDLTDCPAGYYILNIETETGIYNKQIVKK